MPAYHIDIVAAPDGAWHASINGTVEMDECDPPRPREFYSAFDALKMIGWELLGRGHFYKDGDMA